MKRIALVEDNEDNRALIAAVVEDEYELDQYENAPAALAGLPQHRPDILLLDVSLPGMSGLELLRCLRADERLRGLPIVALTAHAMQGDRERFIAEGFDDYLAKPIVNPEDLLDMIERLVDQAR